MDIFLILVSVVLTFLLLLGIIYLVALFQAPEDKNEAWIPKIVVVMSFLLACWSVLLLPLDVANRENPMAVGGDGGGLNIGLAWQICLTTVVIFVVILVPFFIFYYEGWDPDQTSNSRQWRSGLLFTFLSLVIFGGLLVLGWFAWGKAHIDYTVYNAPPTTEPTKAASNCHDCETAGGTLELRVSIFVYAIGLLGALGWVFFVFFGSIGLAAMPFNLWRGFFDRPRPMDPEEYRRKRGQLANITDEMLETCSELMKKCEGGPPGRRVKKEIQKFKAKSQQVEEEHQGLETSYREGGESPFFTLGRVVCAIGSSILSVLWVLHIILNNLAKVTPFLNDLFSALDDIWMLLGVIAYSVFSMYLLWAAVLGVIKAGSRIMFIEIHPMKVNGTMMNSFLYNCFIILLCSVVVSQFCALSFSSFAARTAASSLVTTYISNLAGIGQVYHYAPYALAGFTVFCALLMLICKV